MDFGAIIEVLKGLIETIMGMVGGEGGFDISAITDMLSGLVG